MATGTSLLAGLRAREESEAADRIEELEEEVESLERALERAAADEQEVLVLRSRVRELESVGRFCPSCSFGTAPPEVAFCCGCGARR